MEPTRRFWVVAVLGSASAVLAVLFGDVLWLGITLGVGGWVLIEQFAFTEALAECVAREPITQSLSRETVLVDETATLTLQFPAGTNAFTTHATKLTFPENPALAFEGEREYDLTTVASPITLPLRVAIAGTYEIAPPAVQLTSRRGLFRDTLQLGSGCSLTGEPRVPRNIHIGTGGERIAIADGEHDADQGNAGFEPGELREYLPGDSRARIDWKATARLGQPYVRDLDAETTRQTHLIVDQRSTMLDGGQGQSKLDYAREISVWLTEYVANLEDPLSASLIDEDGAATLADGTATTTQYQQLRRAFLDLTTAPSQSARTTPRQHQPAYGTRSRKAAQQRRSQLTGDDTFSRVLQPYYQNIGVYLQQATDEPLFKTVQGRVADASGDAWLVIVTDDRNRGELLEAARAAASPTTFVTVFILPTILFERPGFTDLEQAYHEYHDFESYRVQLAALTNVTAFEVGPHDRLAALLEFARPQHAHK